MINATISLLINNFTFKHKRYLLFDFLTNCFYMHFGIFFWFFFLCFSSSLFLHLFQSSLFVLDKESDLYSLIVIDWDRIYSFLIVTDYERVCLDFFHSEKFQNLFFHKNFQIPPFSTAFRLFTFRQAFRFSFFSLFFMQL